MKRICSFSIIHIIIFGLISALNSSCDKEVDPKFLPVLTTTEVIKMTEATAYSGGNITSDAGSDVTSRGVCWSESPNPTIEDNKTIDAAGTGVFESRIVGLNPSITYYIRAYATNKKGTAYGLQVTFKTKSLIITTTPITATTINSALSGGTIVTDGDSVNVTERGICWNTSTNPTIANSKIASGKGKGKYSGLMSELQIATQYFVRAYATNVTGTFYGDEVSFITANGSMTLTTTAATSITAISATIGGNVPNDGGATVNERGFCISKLPNPTITNKIANGSGIGSFASNITGLEANTTYYVRVFATNSVGTVYGNEISFTTKDGIITLSTNTATSITATSVTSGATITNDGGTAITARGLCWSTSANPTIANNKSTNTGTNSSFATNITGLNIGTTYFLRAYATNVIGTSYGNEISFTTLDGKINLSTTNISNITAFTATSGGNVIADGGANVTARGICWSTNPNPTISDNKVTNESGIGVYNCSASNLSIGTTYYLRAYATNAIGTSYGNEISFTTLDGKINLSTTNISNITALTATSGGNVIADGGVTVTARGICWSTNPNPTISDNKVTNGSGIGVYNCSASNLSIGTTYYLRAYATNAAGTFYGSEIAFKTLNGTVTLETTSPSVITSVSVKSGGNIISDEGAPVNESGVCWSKSEYPTINNSYIKSTIQINFTVKLTDLEPNTKYYIRAYAKNAAGYFYGNNLNFTTPDNVTDIDGNVYNTVIIGNQTWMVENLRTTKLNDGTSIANESNNSAWAALSSAAYCWYNNNITYKTSYGALYNWHVVNTGKLAPAGWHVPTDSEWTTLENYVAANLATNSTVTKALASNTNWKVSTSVGAIGNDLNKNNSSGFSALPSGSRYNVGTFVGLFTYIDEGSLWWSSTAASAGKAWFRLLYTDFSGVGRNSGFIEYGYSVRCVKD